MYIYISKKYIYKLNFNLYYLIKKIIIIINIIYPKFHF